MMLLLELTFAAEGGLGARLKAVVRHTARYAPFVVLLAGYLLLAYVVNTRSYLVQEGHYTLGWHALPNIFNYIIVLYIGQRAVLDYMLVVAAIAALLVWGSPRARFSLLWIFVTLAPSSFFTWDIATRYLYLPGAGFAMLAADVMRSGGALAQRWMSARAAQTAMVVVVAVLAARFGIFAKKAADSFAERTAPYERFVTELRRANPAAVAGATVHIDQRFLEGVPDLYREPVARIGLCLPDLRLHVQ